MDDATKQAAKQKLLDYLRSCTGGDPENEHLEAEKLMMDWAGREIAEAWKEATENWWYA